MTENPQQCKPSADGAVQSRPTTTDELAHTAVVGLGYVGLPLCLQFARSGHNVLGLDVDQKKVASIGAGNSYIGHIPSDEILSFVGSNVLEASTDFRRIEEVSTVIICVPTPLNKHREPDISYILATGKAIAPHLQKGTLVVLESTTYPGTTDTDLREVIEQGSGLTAGKDFHLAFSPEREDPGNPDSHVGRVPKVVGGYTSACLEKAVSLYSSAVEQVVPVSSCRAAEATKLLENIYRSVNIALVNELKLIYDAMDIDVWEVIEAAKTKPFGFHAFYPGPGLGGHCIPIDPFYLTWKAREYGHPTRFIELAGEINTSMPEHVVRALADALNTVKKPLNGSRVLLIGLAYKPNVEDDRESPGYTLMELMKEAGAEVSYYDPYIPVIPLTREHAEWAGIKSVTWDQASIGSYDACLIATAHDNVDCQELLDWAKIVVDTRNATDGLSGNATVVKA